MCESILVLHPPKEQSVMYRKRTHRQTHIREPHELLDAYQTTFDTPTIR